MCEVNNPVSNPGHHHLGHSITIMVQSDSRSVYTSTIHARGNGESSSSRDWQSERRIISNRDWQNERRIYQYS